MKPFKNEFYASPWKTPWTLMVSGALPDRAFTEALIHIEDEVMGWCKNETTYGRRA